MIKQLLANWKTTSAGMTLIVGSVVPLCFAIKNGGADERLITGAILGVIGGFGFIFAGDAGSTQPPTAPPKP